MILDIFNQSDEAISVVVLIGRLHGQMNKTTIYRILERLEEDAVLHSFLGQDGVKWYARCNDCSTHNHHDVHPHFQCTECGKTECLPIDLVIPELPNRKIASVQVLYSGRCESCPDE